MKSLRKILFGISTFLLSGMMAFSAVLPMLQPHEEVASAKGGAKEGTVTDVTGTVKSDLTQFLDTSVVEKLPENVTADQQISVILSLDTDTILDGYGESGKETVADYAVSGEGKAVSAKIRKESNALLNKISNAGVNYELGNRYDTLLGGFEITIPSGSFDTLCNAVKGKASVMVGEVYAACETEIVENKVNVDKATGIFDSSDSKYDGKGTVIAVLDTGLDATHSAFDVKRFNNEPETDVITVSSLSQVVSKLTAASTTPGLTAQNVYISRKVPFGYDYADKDDDVSPINNAHGTHVAGIMVGKDDTITGVAPNAQLAVMKVFSEKDSGAKQSWILAALEDCVTLGVDVINMSLGSSCGFSRETDEDQRNVIYDRVKEQGISLVAAASNDYNSTFGSEKNGNQPLSSNPDSATVGSPATYDAALSVASISGVKTPYLLYEGTIIYFNEASNSAAEPKDFVDDILADDEETKEFEFVVIPGVGRVDNFTDYMDGSLKGKIALIKRGETNFEEKASLAMSSGAAGCIIYNNVSGDISMNVGRLGDYPVCSISKDDGQMLVDGASRTITISRSQEAGPFMSDFSSWGPAPDLSIKPEITAHGGEIYSAVPGQSYDRMSGTSMASPNQAGVTALVRQYVKETFGLTGNDPETRRQIVATVNCLMMSTTDIAYNTNNLPFSVRKQGSGLANLGKTTSTQAYLQTFDRKTGAVMDKTKIELGDDPGKSGTYTLKFRIVNISSDVVTYDADAIVMTEGLSETITYKGDRTANQKGYLLGAEVEVTGVTGGKLSGKTITVDKNGTADVEMTITLSSEDRAYLDTSFENGMYVEGFVTLTAKDGTKVSLNAPYLAFYGDWGAAPLFDLDYFETYKDELNDLIAPEEKTLPDAYATRPLGGLYSDYIVYLGAYPYLQNPASANIIAADRDRIALSNQIGSDEGSQGGVNSIYGFYFGLLRNAKRMVMTITDKVTGEVIFTHEELNVKKSYNYGGSIGPSVMRVEFNSADYDLKNNTQYQVTVTGEIDYGDGTVRNNVFEFPFYTDFSAPIVTDVKYSYEYDNDLKKNRLYADISIYDNHYVQAIAPGYISGTQGNYTLYTFERYLTPVSGSRNSTNVVRYELTDYLETLKQKSYNGRGFLIQVMDCAQNTSMFEIGIPDDIATISFKEDEIKINPNEIYTLQPDVSPAQDKAWMESIVYTSSDESIARVVGGKLLGISSGTVTLTARSNRNEDVFDTVQVKVLGEGDEGYDPNLAKLRIEPNSFRLTGYRVNRVYYFVSSDERDLGVDSPGYTVKFSSNSPSLKMLPSESVTLEYDFTAYLDSDKYKVVFSSDDSNIASVDADGTILARLVDRDGKPRDVERSTSITATLYMYNDATQQYEATPYTKAVYVTVKTPYTTNGPYLMSYKGLGGKVEIPSSYGFTTIQDFAFSNYQFVPKDLSAGDVIDDEDPYLSKQWYIGDNTINEVIVPEGVESIGMYAFAGLTALRSITLPSTLTKIQTGAFMNCTALTEIKFSSPDPSKRANNLQFINTRAFEGCSALVNFELNSVIAIGDSAFKGSGLINLNFPESTRSIGAEAFAESPRLSSVSFAADSIKVGAGAFRACDRLSRMSVNSTVLSAQLFEGCSSLRSLTIGKDVEVIGHSIFKNSGIRTISLDPANPNFTLKTTSNGVQYLVEKNAPEVLAFVSPSATAFTENTVTEISASAFSSVTGLTSVNLPKVTKIGDYAFNECTSLRSAVFGDLERVGAYAFFRTAISSSPKFAQNVEIGERAYSLTNISSVVIPDGTQEEGQNLTQVGAYAFAQLSNLTRVQIGNNVDLGEGAFYFTYRLASVKIGDNAVLGFGAFAANSYSALSGSVLATGNVYEYYGSPLQSVFDPFVSALSSLTIGANADIGEYAFRGAGCLAISSSLGGELTSVQLGKGAKIGNFAFYGCHNLSDIDLSEAVFIGDGAFAGVLGEYVMFRNAAGQQWMEQWGNIAFAAAMTTADLSGLQSPAGEGAFSMTQNLETVILPARVTEIAPYTFEQTPALRNINLNRVTSIGEGAFALSGIRKVNFARDVKIGDVAFYGCEELAEANLGRAYSIGDSAFAGTAITVADLTGAREVGDYVFVGSSVSSVVFGENLNSVGENPFAGLDIPAFEKEGETTFDIGRKIKVVDGVLYSACPNGFVLVCYPLGKTDTVSYKVEEGTVRIGGGAFLGTNIVSVVLPRDVKAIGDRAFCDCAELISVTFNSVNAPILEESYLTEYDTETDEIGAPLYLVDAVGLYTAPLNDGSTRDYGLQIVDFRMWLSDSTNVLYGANFVARIGNVEGRAIHDIKKLIMVRPINGVGYDSFIYGQYFDVTLDGVTAIGDEAQNVIDLIAALPLPVTLADEAQVNAVRALYNALTPDQQGRVYNLDVLVAAETQIKFLQQQSQETPEQPEDPGDNDTEKGCGGILSAGSAVMAVFLALSLAMILRAGRKEQPAESRENRKNGTKI